MHQRQGNRGAGQWLAEQLRKGDLNAETLGVIVTAIRRIVPGRPCPCCGRLPLC